MNRTTDVVCGIRVFPLSMIFDAASEKKGSDSEERERERDKQADRQTDRQTDTHIDRQTNRQTGEHRGR